jgi:hypothetical protein
VSFLPQVIQGNLNRAAVHIVVNSYPALSLTASTMSKGQAHLTYEGDAVTQIGTATGIIDSPEPYLMTTLVVNILRTQPVANAWLLQQQSSATIGTVEVYPDATSYSPTVIQNCAIQNIDPGPYDGSDPTVRITMRGQVQINSSMWAGLIGTIAAIV